MRSTSALTLLCVLGSPMILASCKTILPSSVTEAQIAGRICNEAWLPITLSHHDTEQTQAEVKAANRARKAFCK